MEVEYPEKASEFFQAIAGKELVALHSHQTWPENEQYVTMNFFPL
jgi:predicted SnoaL-like aldol condensation-catalyzing enzyme